MQVGMIGLGRMGANMVRRLTTGGHACVVYDADHGNVKQLREEGATGAGSIEELATKLVAPRAIWLMVPATVVDRVMDALTPCLDAGDVVVDGGNSHYADSMRRATMLRDLGIHFLDVGTSGGVLGRERGYCLMIGGDPTASERLAPIFGTLAPAGTAEMPRDGSGGFLHCGPSGAGHFLKMVHNGIEYGLMQAYAEGLNLLKQTAFANGSAAFENAEPFRHKFDLPRIAELWRHGSVISSWLLDLLADALVRDPKLGHFTGRVADSGEGRWMLEAAMERGTPLPVLAAALFARFSSRDGDDFANRVLSALRREFGGHAENAPESNVERSPR